MNEIFAQTDSTMADTYVIHMQDPAKTPVKYIDK